MEKVGAIRVEKIRIKWKSEQILENTDGSVQPSTPISTELDLTLLIIITRLSGWTQFKREVPYIVKTRRIKSIPNTFDGIWVERWWLWLAYSLTLNTGDSGRPIFHTFLQSFLDPNTVLSLEQWYLLFAPNNHVRPIANTLLPDLYCRTTNRHQNVPIFYSSYLPHKLNPK